MNIKIEIVLALLTQFIGLCFFVWKVSAWYTILETRIEANNRDINNVANAARESARENYQVIQMQISHIQEHLAKTGDYLPPSLKKWEGS